jgi:hypothetical protein
MDYRRITFQGYSMYPVLRPGDTLILDIVSAAECALGDIVCVPGKHELVVHRIIGVDRSTSPPALITKGDNLTYPDPPITFPAGGVFRVIMTSRGARGLVRPRFGRLMVFLSRRNMTIGIVRATIGRAARWMSGRFLAPFQKETPRP